MRAAAEKGPLRGSIWSSFWSMLPVLLLAFGCGSGRGITPIRTPFNKGVYHQSRGDLEAAVAEYRRALRENPDDVPARFNLATALDEQARALQADDSATASGLRAVAEREYLEVLRREPGNVRAEVNLAALEHERGDTAAARARLQRAIAAHPDLALPATALALRQLEAGEPAAAEATLQLALRREELDVSANLLLGRLRLEQGRLDEARLLLRKVLRRESDDAGALLLLAEVESRAGRDAAALALLQQVLLADGDQLDAHLQAAALHERRGALEDAVFHLWRARALDRTRPPRLDYAARLASLYSRLLEQLGP